MILDHDLCVQLIEKKRKELNQLVGDKVENLVRKDVIKISKELDLYIESYHMLALEKAE